MQRRLSGAAPYCDTTAPWLSSTSEEAAPHPQEEDAHGVRGHLPSPPTNLNKPPAPPPPSVASPGSGAPVGTSSSPAPRTAGFLHLPGVEAGEAELAGLGEDDLSQTIDSVRISDLSLTGDGGAAAVVAAGAAAVAALGSGGGGKGDGVGGLAATAAAPPRAESPQAAARM